MIAFIDEIDQAMYPDGNTPRAQLHRMICAASGSGHCEPLRTPAHDQSDDIEDTP